MKMLAPLHAAVTLATCMPMVFDGKDIGCHVKACMLAFARLWVHGFLMFSLCLCVPVLPLGKTMPVRETASRLEAANEVDYWWQCQRQR